jgi:putative transposase
VRRLKHKVARLTEERDILKKSGGLSRQDDAMRFAFIQIHAKQFHIITMCHVLVVSRAGYYAWVERAPSTCTG